MRHLPTILLLSPVALFAGIIPGSLHLTEATRIEANFTSNGLSTEEFDVNIAHLAGTTDYYLSWYGIEWEDTGSAFIRCGFSIVNVADVIAHSNWTPTYLYIGFEDKMIRMNADDVTFMARNLSEMSNMEVYAYFLEHATVVEYAI